MFCRGNRRVCNAWPPDGRRPERSPDAPAPLWQARYAPPNLDTTELNSKILVFDQKVFVGMFMDSLRLPGIYSGIFLGLLEKIPRDIYSQSRRKSFLRRCPFGNNKQNLIKYQKFWVKILTYCIYFVEGLPLLFGRVNRGRCLNGPSELTCPHHQISNVFFLNIFGKFFRVLFEVKKKLYLNQIKNVQFVNFSYNLSSCRKGCIASNLLLQIHFALSMLQTNK